MTISARLLLSVIAFILFRSLWTRLDAYHAFLCGAKAGLDTTLSILPTLCAVLLMLHLAQDSGLMTWLSGRLAPALSWFRIPAGVTPLLLLRPLTGSGSMAALQEVLRTYGPNSREAMLASVLMGSGETIFYTLTLYLSAAGLRRLPRVIGISLTAAAVGALVAAQIV